MKVTRLKIDSKQPQTKIPSTVSVLLASPPWCWINSQVAHCKWSQNASRVLWIYVNYVPWLSSWREENGGEWSKTIPLWTDDVSDVLKLQFLKARHVLRILKKIVPKASGIWVGEYGTVSLQCWMEHWLWHEQFWIIEFLWTHQAYSGICWFWVQYTDVQWGHGISACWVTLGFKCNELCRVMLQSVTRASKLIASISNTTALWEAHVTRLLCDMPLELCNQDIWQTWSSFATYGWPWQMITLIRIVSSTGNSPNLKQHSGSGIPVSSMTVNINSLKALDLTRPPNDAAWRSRCSKPGRQSTSWPVGPVCPWFLREVFNDIPESCKGASRSH